MSEKKSSLPLSSVSDYSTEIDSLKTQKLYLQRFNRTIAIIAICTGFVGAGLILYGIPKDSVGEAVWLVLQCLQFTRDRLVS